MGAALRLTRWLAGCIAGWLAYRWLLIRAWTMDRAALIEAFRIAKETEDGRHAREVENLQGQIALQQDQIKTLTAMNSRYAALIERDVAILAGQTAIAMNPQISRANQ